MDKNPIVACLEEGAVSIPSFLLNRYKKIGLTDVECMLLIHVHAFLEKGNGFPTPEDLAEKMQLSPDECSQKLRSLIRRGYLEILKGETEAGIYYEKYSLRPLWERLAESWLKEQKGTEEKERREKESSLFNLFEQEFARPLSPLEYETIAMWLDEDRYPVPLVKAALREAVISGKLNLRYIDRILFEWRKNGIQTVEQAKEYGKRFRKDQMKEKNEPKEKNREAVFYNWLDS